MRGRGLANYIDFHASMQFASLLRPFSWLISGFTLGSIISFFIWCLAWKPIRFIQISLTHLARKDLFLYTAGLSVLGVPGMPGHPQILTDQFPLAQPGPGLVRSLSPPYYYYHGLRTPGEEIVFTARPKIKSQSQIFRYGRSIFFSAISAQNFRFQWFMPSLGIRSLW